MALITAFSADSLDPTSSTPPPHRNDEQWSDAHDTLETDDDRDMIHELPIPEEDLTITPPKLAATRKSHDIHPTSPDVPDSATTQLHVHDEEQEQDSHSIQSVPVVQVTEPTSPTIPMSSYSASSVFTPSTTTTLTPASASTSSRDRRRSTVMDGRTSNRISGFFSSLIHRRELPTLTRDSMAPTPESKPPPRSSSIASSQLPSRPSTPPPTLPPPNLSDLGLTLSTMTTHLSPSHFSSPPSNGAYISPNYLLLCHAQGLDVLPLSAPPAVQPYTLIRQVPFKSVVVMEHRGVLVAIAGRRDGVRVYALEAVKRAIEWRMDVEIRRERERTRREEAKRAVTAGHETHRKNVNADKDGKVRLFSNTPASGKEKTTRRASISTIQPMPSPGIPRTPTIKRTKPSGTPSAPIGPPPAYSPSLRGRGSHVNLNTNPSRARTTSVSDVLAGTMNRRRFSDDADRDENNDDTKGDWASSDDEAINPVTAPSGSQALDERTSAGATTSPPPAVGVSGSRLEVPRTSTSSLHNRRHRPANLDLSLTRAGTSHVIPPAPPSPTPTLLTLRQALLSSPGSLNVVPTRRTLHPRQDDPDADDDDGEVAPSTPATPTRERISLAEALFESRLPDVPPVGTQRPQEAILLSSVASGEEDIPASPRSSESHSNVTGRSFGEASSRRRRRWSVLDGIFTPSSAHASRSSIHTVPEGPSAHGISSSDPPPIPQIRERSLSRSQSSRLSTPAPPLPTRPSTSPRPSTAPGREVSMSLPPTAPVVPSLPSRLIPRIITNALGSRRSEDRLPVTPKTAVDIYRGVSTPTGAQAPAPKLEYEKLPGTKGSVMVKAVETGRKSFLAILCGDNGEKVELFAGTYRTMLGLSRTFILPDSPRSLELQLQGDDLVEVFLVFSQNVFGLEPATVRVREVRIGRAERRAARRRVRENRTADQQAADGDGEGTGGNEEDISVNVTVGVAVTPASPTSEEGILPTALPSPSPSVVPPLISDTPTNNEAAYATDELLTMAAASASPYSTFQQLSFAPKFPLAAIADDYVIPPTYPSFIEYRNQYEPEVDGNPNVDLSQIQFSPPGLPVPIPAPPSKWFYKDPKGIIHGPWKAALMEAWYHDGLLPPELPIRREEDAEYVLLKDLRLQCIDPTHPFRSSPPAPTHTQAVPLPLDETKPLLKPISLLKQPRHFGPPALFYSSRGGHSTVVVDARGRSVLKGRFLWSSDDAEGESSLPRLGDVKRLEAFDVKDRAVLVAMRQGGLEVVDFGDALLRPADYSRMVYPTFNPPPSSINRRGPYVWKIGTPLSSSSSAPVVGLPVKFPAHRLQPKKQSTGPAKSPARSEFYPNGAGDPDVPDEEILFLARRDDEIFLCERRTGSFRILRLSVSDS